MDLASAAAAAGFTGSLPQVQPPPRAPPSRGGHHEPMEYEEEEPDYEAYGQLPTVDDLVSSRACALV